MEMNTEEASELHQRNERVYEGDDGSLIALSTHLPAVCVRCTATAVQSSTSRGGLRETERAI